MAEIIIHFIIIVMFVVYAIRLAVGLRGESPVFREFGQSRTLVPLVLLGPLGPVFASLLIYRIGVLPAYLAAAACFVPVMVAARRRWRCFETAGTDRVERALKLSYGAFGLGLVGVVYACAGLVYHLVMISVTQLI